MNMMPLMTSRPMTLDEYLEFEAGSSLRHEFVNGEIYAFAGASRRHSRIISNLVFQFVGVTRGGPCEIHSNDVKLRAAPEIVYYPDVMVVCDPDDDDDLIVTRPCLVIEVLSRSTESTDRREKLMVYRQIPSLGAYLLIDQEQRRVVRHWRDDEGSWWWAELSRAGEIPLDCPEMSLGLDQIYEGIDFRR